MSKPASTWAERHAAYLDYAKTFPTADEATFQAGYVLGARRSAGLLYRLVSADALDRPFPYRYVPTPPGQECMWCGSWETGHHPGCPWVEAWRMLRIDEEA